MSASVTEPLNGHCFCGNVSFSINGEMTWACYCHCQDCRRNCAAPIVAFLGVRLTDFSWEMKDHRDEPAHYASSKGVKRFFCDQCGTPMAFQAEHYDGEIHLYAATLTNPDMFTPEFHVHYEEKLSWLSHEDSLHKYAASAPADAELRQTDPVVKS